MGRIAVKALLATFMRPEEAAMFLDEMGLEEAGLDRLIRAGYKLLELETYFTVGPKEARAWTIKGGTYAPQAAGVIHGDFERGFIRAETIAYEDYVALEGEQKSKEAGNIQKPHSATYGFFYSTSFYVKCLLGIDFSHAIGHG